MTLLPVPRRADIGTERFPIDGAPAPTVLIEPGHRPEGYRLRIGRDGAQISASDDAGAERARTTLGQLTEGGTVPAADITDWPEFPVRGLMLDVSRDKVPTIETLEWLIDVMAGWKMNHLELYVEHTFAYSGHDDVWRDASPFTSDEISHLRSYCQDRNIELTPNQNCLGHMERWLARPRYRDLAVVDPRPAVLDWLAPFPTTIDPSLPGSLSFARSLLAELLPHFSSSRVHVGLDEPWELGPHRMPDYAAYLAALRDSEETKGREMLVWGDILATHPELIGQVPDGVTVCEWGYEADHPFPQRLAALADAGLETWVCPGTSSWDSVIGRWTNARLNCLGAAQAGRDAGATGYLVTDWGDNGHLQPLPVSLPGLAAAAAAAWNPDGAEGVDHTSAVADLVGRRPAEALVTLGDAHLAVSTQIPNFASIVLHLIYPQFRVGSGFTGALDDEQLDRYEAILDESLAGLPAGETVTTELELAVDIVRLASADARARVHVDGAIRSVPEADRLRLATMADELVERHRSLWTVRNRPGGREDSADRLRHLARCYREGEGAAFVPAWQAGNLRTEELARARAASGNHQA